jgi:hypothetical protein
VLPPAAEVRLLSDIAVFRPEQTLLSKGDFPSKRIVFLIADSP